MNRRPVSGSYRRWVSEDSTGSFRLADLHLSVGASGTAGEDMPVTADGSAATADHGAPSWTAALDAEMEEEDNA